MNWGYSPRCSTAGKKSSSRTALLPVQEPPGPPSRAGADRVPGEEDPDQGRGLGGVDGRAHRLKKKSWGALTSVLDGYGPQFIARDFKEFIRIAGMTHVRTSPYYPQSNGKLERWHKSLKSECIRPGTPLTREDALRLIQTYVDHYNTVRLHSAIGYVTPQDMLAGRQAEIHAARDRKIEEARHQRQLRRAAESVLAHFSNTPTMNLAR